MKMMREDGKRKEWLEKERSDVRRKQKEPRRVKLGKREAKREENTDGTDERSKGRKSREDDETR